METNYFTFSDLRRYLRVALKRVSKGEQIIITVWGKPVAKLIQYGKGKEK
jgi:prevent-host-death family protein